MQLLTVRDVAQRLKVSRSLVYQLVEAGTIACHRIGTGRGTIRIHEEDVVRFLSHCRRENTTKYQQHIIDD